MVNIGAFSLQEKHGNHEGTVKAIGYENERQKLTTVDSRTMNASFMLGDRLVGEGMRTTVLRISRRRRPRALYVTYIHSTFATFHHFEGHGQPSRSVDIWNGNE